MVQGGHVIIDGAGRVLDMDSAFCDIMHADPATLRGRSFLDAVTAADRVGYSRALATLRQTKRAFLMIAEFVRDDGSPVCLRTAVSVMMDDGPAPMIVATVERVEAPTGDDGPAILLDVARFMVGARCDRGAVCDRALFSDPGWDAVLAAYIAEAEGRAVDVAMLSMMLDHAPATIERWVKALLQHGVLEIESRDSSADAAKAYRLTAGTHRKLETYLSHIRPRHRELAMHDPAHD